MLTAIWWGGVAAASLLIGYVLVGRGISNRMLGTEVQQDVLKKLEPRR